MPASSSQERRHQEQRMITSPTTVNAEKLSIKPPKRFLYGPGPSQVHPRVYEALSKQIVGHMDPYFFEVSQGIQSMLRNVFGTANDITLAISATGSGGMETAVSNFVEPGMKVGLFSAGFFADRIGEMAKRHGGNVVRFEKPWGEIASDDEARDFIRRERPSVVAFVQAETSTGAFQPSRSICEAAHEVAAIVIADCVTSLGAMPVELDKNGIDVAYSCTQKGLSCPPGLSPVSLSPRAVERIKARTQPNRSWYFDLALLLEYYEGAHRYHHTASATLFYALHEALSLIEEEGVENRFSRHHAANREFVKGIESLGLRMHVPEQHRIWNLSTPRVPAGVDDAKVRSYLLSKHGIEIMGGFGPLAGKVFRIGIMGPLATTEGVNFFLGAFEEALHQAEYKP
ncbi:MAG: aminotransferase class V-fold PLP-dependent enzyme [Terriglobia bacterium]|nr:aminotransferase class V-fold PLP-dependent enzyme [Terriglobia bacterium]